MTDYIYDLETYPNCITACFLNADTMKGKVFEISNRKNESEELLDFLRILYREKSRLVGFNVISFDYPILHYFLKHKGCSVQSIYRKAMSLIEANEDDRFKNLVKPEDVLIPQIDLFKIHHFDNKARATSLKVLEFNMRSDTIEDLPFQVGSNLNSDQIDMLIKYNKHDVMRTYDFYKYTIPMIKFRENLTTKYSRDFMNHNDTKIGKDYFIMRLEENKAGSCYKVDTHGNRKIQQTRRKSIALKDCIFSYVKFDRPEFAAIHNWFKQQVITETKGVFSDILEHNLGDVAKYARLVKKEKKLKDKPTGAELEALKKEKPLCWIEERELKSKKIVWYVCWNIIDALNVVINDLEYVFGVGGLHASVESKIFAEDFDYEIIDCDVSSMYPNLAISNNLHPEHLGVEFCKIYRDMYIQRKSYDKKSAENAMLKLALNGTYGDSNNEFSPFYDPKFTMSITVGGQLSLCMLVEKFLDIENLTVIQCNTDGITVRLPRSKRMEYDEVCKHWQQTVKLDLEYAFYKKMYVRDVNNYLSIYTDNKVKMKGAYEYQDIEKLKDDPNYPFAWHKNQSCLVVPKAVEAALVHGKDVESFIRGHDDKMDFMLRVKVPRSNKLISIDSFGSEKQEQNICRYYVSNNGVELKKIMPPLEGSKVVRKVTHPETNESVMCRTEPEIKRYLKKGYVDFGDVEVLNEERPQLIVAGWKVNICNNMKNYIGDINYNYYIAEAKKLVEELTK